MSTAGSVLLDTNVVVAFFRGEETARARIAATMALYLPWIALGELHYGALRAQRQDEQLASIRDFLATAIVLFPDQDTTAHYAQIKAALAQAGRPIPDNDIWIAALSRQHDLPLATRDAHFEAIPRLTLLSW
jgi:tRNA(fMet)-specific endonuclease VapC